MGATNKRLKRKACIGKRQYATHNDAMTAAHIMAKKHQERISAYKCTFGDHYHVGHTPKAIKRFIGH